MEAGTRTTAPRDAASARDGRPVVEAERVARQYAIGDVSVTALAGEWRSRRP